MAMDFYAKNGLFPRVNDYAAKKLLRAEKVCALKAEIEELEKKVPKLTDQLAEEKRREGSVIFSEEKVKAKQEEILANALAIATKKEELEQVNSLPEVKFSFNTDQDAKLRKAWKDATTPAMRISALADWFSGYGIPGAYDSKGRVDARIVQLDYDLHHIRTNGMTGVILDGEAWTKDAALSFGTLYAKMVDWGFEFNQMKENLISEELKDMFQKRRDAAKAAREAKKAAKKNQK